MYVRIRRRDLIASNVEDAVVDNADGVKVAKGARHRAVGIEEVLALASG